MSTDRDLTPVLRSWLHEDAHEDAGRVLDVVLEQIDVTAQRRPWWPARRGAPASNAFRFAIAAAVLVSAAILGYAYLNSDVGSTTPTPLQVATPGELPATGALKPGRYVYVNPYVDQDPIHFNCTRGCPDYRSITFTVPNGWSVADGLVAKHRDGPNEVALSFWAPDWVYSDPCHWEATPVVEGQDFGPFTPSGQGAGAHGMNKLANQAGRRGSAATEVTFGRQPSASVFLLELSVPADLDISRCDGGEYRSWTVWQAPERANSHHAAGQVDDIYFVDVDRHALLIDASHRSQASVQDMAELQAVLDSIVIDRSFPTSSPTS